MIRNEIVVIWVSRRMAVSHRSTSVLFIFSQEYSSYQITWELYNLFTSFVVLKSSIKDSAVVWQNKYYTMCHSCSHQHFSCGKIRILTFLHHCTGNELPSCQKHVVPSICCIFSCRIQIDLWMSHICSYFKFWLWLIISRWWFDLHICENIEQ